MLWAVTSYFNPCNYRRRLANYQVFRRRLQVPLVAVELSFDGEFQLARDDADIMIRVRGGDVMWQKERLLNIALGYLPAACDQVAWIDCDVIFGHDGWPAAARRALERHPVIQLYDRYLEVAGENETEGPEEDCESVSKALATGRLGREIFGVEDVTPYRIRCGAAWAARREVLDRHGFYDACIVGGGDRAMAAAMLAAHGHVIGYQSQNPRRARHYREWSERVFETVRGNLGFCDGTVYHLKHGERRDRFLKERHTGLADHDFDPAQDLELDEGGCWRWNSDKPEMHRFVRDYFARRMEDGPEGA